MKTIFYFISLFIFLENGHAENGPSCNVDAVIDDAHLELTSILPKVDKSIPAPTSAFEIVEINGESFYVVGDEEISYIIPLPPSLASKKGPSHIDPTTILGPQDIEYIPSAFLVPKKIKATPPSLPKPLTVGISPELKIIFDKIPSSQNYFFPNPQGKIVGHVGLDKKVSKQFYLQSNRPLSPKEFAEYTRSQGKEIKLVPFTKEVEGEIVHVQGGLREVYIDQVPDDYLYKKMKDEEITGFSPDKYADLSKREVAITKRVNHAFAQSADDIGIAVHVEPHDYSYTHVGYWRIKKVPGVTLYEYRKKLGPEALKKFNEQLLLLQNKIKEENKIAGRMVNRYFNDMHAYKGLHPKEARKILKEVVVEAAGDNDKFVDIMAERGYLADIDMGRIRFSEDGLGHEKDLNNCHVYEIQYKGKTIPKIHCYDI